MRNVIVVSRRSHWPLEIEGVEVVTARQYLSERPYSESSSLRVFNVCRSYKFQSTGYYVSLLAEARGQRVIPDVATLQDFLSRTLVRAVAEDVDELIQESLSGVDDNRFFLNIYFGQTAERRYRALGRRLYTLFQAPLLRVSFVHADRWLIQQMSPLSFTQVPDEDRALLGDFAARYFSRKRFRRGRIQQYAYDLGILVNPNESSPPSDRCALDRFMKAAGRAGFFAEFITREDYGRINEFDGLFIRETTSVNHHTYRFSRRAFAEGLVVIDDPWSILRCTNKVYLAEMLARLRLPCPRTVIVQKEDLKARSFPESFPLGFPCVLKKPDSAFSVGVTRVHSAEELVEEVRRLFRTSDLVIAQEFVPSEYDWRIGILDNQPLFACKYYMAQGHWQIYDWNREGGGVGGDSETVPVEEAPRNVVELAMKAAAAIGNGLYGVDLKQVGDKVVVIEVNDNPNVDCGVEDAYLGDALYDTVLRTFRKQIDAARQSSVR
jgi:glutathione synthase/RimK-type ligase-like ATP-grasp enzyme